MLQNPEDYKARILKDLGLTHISFEINQCAATDHKRGLATSTTWQTYTGSYVEYLTVREPRDKTAYCRFQWMQGGGYGYR